MLITCIPGHNSNPERVRLIDSSCNSIISSSLSRAVLTLLHRRKEIKIVEVWYPQHFLLLILAKLLDKKTVFSPVTNSLLWFDVKGYLKVSPRYTIRRLLNWFLEEVSLLFSDLLLIQDSSLLEGWECRVRLGVRIEVVNNIIPEIDMISSSSRKGILCLGNLEEHKMYYFNTLIKDWESVDWFGRRKRVFAVPTNMTYKGYIDKSQIRKILGSYEVLAHPSCYEGSPRVVYEAIASNLLIRVHYKLKGLDDVKKFFPKNFNQIDNSSITKEELLNSIVSWNLRSIQTRRDALRG